VGEGNKDQKPVFEGWNVVYTKKECKKGKVTLLQAWLWPRGV